MKSRVVVALALVGILAVLAPAVEAEVLRVVVVKAADPAAYVAEINRGRGIMKKAGSPGVIRVWRAQYAGTDAGAVVVSVEYPDMMALAQDNARMATDADVRAWLAGLDKVRTIVSDSVYSEMK
jgi:hypothetical protein